MDLQYARQLELLSRQLSEDLMSAALCAKEINAIAQSQVQSRHDDASVLGAYALRLRDPHDVTSRPLLDESTLSVTWRGSSLHLGHTQGYLLLAYLTRRANQYVTHLDLLRDIWDDEFADTSLLRAGVYRLRAKLRHGGMADLAKAITGHRGRYILNLG